MTKAEVRRAVRRQAFEHKMEQFGKKALEKYGSYTYEAVYLTFLVKDMFDQLTPKQQEFYLKSMENV